MLSTPRNTQDGRTPSWRTDLDAYLASHGLTPLTEGAVVEQRAELIAAVKASPKEPETWFAFLNFEEQHIGNVMSGIHTRPTHEPGAITLYHLYFWATQLVPRSAHQHKEEYIKLWIGYAKHQWTRNEDDARDTFKTIKNQQIGDRCAELYAGWAALEQSVGNTSKALGILAKGMKENAQPAALLEQQKMEIQSGTFDLKAAQVFTETITMGLNSARMATVPEEMTAQAGGATGASSRPKSGANGHHVTFEAVLDGAMQQSADKREAASKQQTPLRTGSRGGKLDSTCSTGNGLDSYLTSNTVHSSSSRSTCSGPAPSYKSSSTERSQPDQQEEDTISCKGAARGDTVGSHVPGASQNRTAPTPSGTAAAAAGNNTTGLRRFGFKSRALRVGGGSGCLDENTLQKGAAAREPHHAAVDRGQVQASQQQASFTVPQPPGEVGIGRKRGPEPPAAAPDPSVSPALASSPKLAAIVASGHQQKCLPSGQVSSSSHGGQGHTHNPAAPLQPVGTGAKGNAEDSDDSVPLVCSKLAAKLAVDRYTPMARRHSTSSECSRDTVVLEPSSQPSPNEGQLPSSLQSTPDALGSGSTTCGGSSQRSFPGAAAAPSQDWEAGGGSQATVQELAVPPTVVLCPSQEESQAKQAVDRPASGQGGPSAEYHSVAGRSSMQPSNGAQEAVNGVIPEQAVPAKRLPLRPMQPSNASSAAVAVAARRAADKPQAGPAEAAQPKEANADKKAAAVGPSSALPPGRDQPAAAPQAPQQPTQPKQLRPREDAQTVYVQGTRYTKLECVGRGGSSKVFKVMGPSCKIYALKRIRLQGRDPEAAAGFIDEINLLQRLLNKPNIIQLIDSQVFNNEGLIYMVQEYGEIDLARLLAKHEAARREGGGGGEMDENFIRLYWQQMLQAVNIVHDLRIVHSDLKPANFLLVEGQLKLIDFGIAKAIQNDTTSIARESQVGTLNYMSPEAILGGSQNILGGPAMKVGRASDIWSLGCILYQMVYGRTPFADLAFLPKMHAICDAKYAIKYPPCSNVDVVGLMRRCLDRDPKTRITMEELLEHPFLHPNRPRAPAAAPTQSMGALSEEQLRQLIAEVARAGAAGPADIDKLTRQLMTQLTTSALGGDNRDNRDNSTTSIDSSVAAAAAVAAAAGGSGSGRSSRSCAGDPDAGAVGAPPSLAHRAVPSAIPKHNMAAAARTVAGQGVACGVAAFSMQGSQPRSQQGRASREGEPALPTAAAAARRSTGAAASIPATELQRTRGEPQKGTDASARPSSKQAGSSGVASRHPGSTGGHMSSSVSSGAARGGITSGSSSGRRGAVEGAPAARGAVQRQQSGLEVVVQQGLERFRLDEGDGR